MPRLINAKEFIKRIDRYPPDIRDIAKKELSYCKTVDAVPVVHGHWGEPQRDGCITYDKNAYRQCSVCGNRQFLGMQMNYCPHCGAKMDEVTENG